MRAPVRSLCLLLLVGLGAGMLLAAPASARPAQVRPPHVVAASPTSLTLTWPAAAGARRYVVSYATSFEGVKRSSAAKRTFSGTRGRVTGLRPGRMYCFMVAAQGRGGTGSRSPRHCKMTLPSATVTRGRSQVSVATFNVCSRACSNWSGRRAAVVDRILRARADVVALQETSRAQDLDGPLAAQGFALAAASGTERLYYRRSLLEPVVATVRGEECTDGEVAYPEGLGRFPRPEDVGWNYDDAVTGRAYWWRDGGWWFWGRTCAPVTRDEPAAGAYGLGPGTTAVWAQLRLRGTGRSWLFADTHLTPGKDESDARRRAETTELLARTRASLAGSGARGVVYLGDFNAQRHRKDSPRTVLEAAGYVDAYDASATYTNPHVNSANPGMRAVPSGGVTYGDHVDRVFFDRRTVSSTGWEVVLRLSGGRYATPYASDHNPVRTTLYLS